MTHGTPTTTTNHRDRVRKCSCTPWYSPWAWIHNVACDLLDESVELHDYFDEPDSNYVYGLSFRFVSSETDERLVAPKDVNNRSLERWFATDAERRHFVEVEELFDVLPLP